MSYRLQFFSCYNLVSEPINPQMGEGTRMNQLIEAVAALSNRQDRFEQLIEGISAKLDRQPEIS